MSNPSLQTRVAKTEERLDNQRDRIAELHHSHADQERKIDDSLSSINQKLFELGRNQERVLWVAIGAFSWYAFESVGLLELVKVLL